MSPAPPAASQLAAAALGVLAVDPLGVGGAVIRARPGSHLTTWLQELRERLPPGTPWRRLPARMDPERLTGELDAVESLRTGRRVWRPGLLAAHHEGVLVVPMAERIPPEQATLLGEVLDRGEVPAPGPGGEPSPARVALLLLDESREDEPGPPELLGERVALRFGVDPVPRGADAALLPTPEQVVEARDRLPRVRLPEGVVEGVAELTLRLGIPSLRAPVAALTVARAAAALSGRTTVGDDELALAVALVLLPRAVHLPAPPPSESPVPEEAPPPPPRGEEGGDEATPPGEGPLPDRVLEAARARLPEDALPPDPERGGGRAGRRGALIRQLRDGYRVGARPGDPRREGRIDLAATLRAAAPWQVQRRGRAGGAGEGRKLLLTPGDLHVQVRARRSATATIFAVDASGSQALHRLAEAKGAVELLLGESYVRREEVALVAFRGRGAEVLLPPTRSLVRARRALAGLPGGGGTPLALGLLESLRLGRRLRAAEATPRVVLLSDGRPNVDREGEGGRTRAREDALAAARLFREEGIPLLVLDTSPRGEPFAGELASAAGGRALHLPRADARSVRAAIGSLDG